jgi:hypothetical protein
MAVGYTRNPGAAAVKNSLPPDGPLSANAVDELLKLHNVPGASIAVIESSKRIAGRESDTW